MSVTTAPRADAQMTVDALAAATPADRDRTVDLLRALAIAVVVLGHWLMAVITWRHGHVTGRNLLQVAPGTQWLTWGLQVMPLFFVVGGYANAASWTSASRRLLGYPAWLHGRVSRLLRPVVPLVAAWTVGLCIARLAGADPHLLHTAARLVGMPLWFLAVYLGVVAATPPMLALHRRYGLRVPAALACAALIVDTLAWRAGQSSLAWTNFALVWLCVHQLGFAWRDPTTATDGDGRGSSDDRPPRLRWHGAALALGGLVAMVVLTQLAGYPRSMVGGPGARSNNTPPSVALVALAVLQLGLVLLAHPALERWLRRPRVWRAVVGANGLAMTLFLWHLTALCLASIGLLATGWFPQPQAATVTWWLLRPMWLVALGAFLAPLVAGAAQVERRPVPRRASRIGPAAAARAAAAAALVAASLGVFSVFGFPVFDFGGMGRTAQWMPLVAIGGMWGGVALLRTALLMELTCPAGRSGLRAGRRRRARWSTLPA